MRKLRAKGAGRAARLVRNALFTRLHLCTARAYGEPRNKVLHLEQGFQLAKDADIRKYMKDRRALPALVRAERVWKDCNANPKLHGFQHFRHKQLAHRAEPDNNVRTPTYTIVFEKARNTAKAMEKFANATGVVTLSLRSQMIVPKRQIAAFWKPWSNRANT